MTRAHRTRFISFLCLISLGLAAQLSAQQKTDPNRVAAERCLSILEPMSSSEMFNGIDLDGWTVGRLDGGQGAMDIKGYAVEDGKLVCLKGGKNLYSAREYSDFAFQFEFKLEESGNNGVGIRTPRGGHPASAGMEIQILDHHGKKYGGVTQMESGGLRKLSWLKPWQYHGSIYGIAPAKTGYLKPVGEWNQETIVAIEDHVIVILNGAVIVDAFLDDLRPVDGGVHPGMKNRSGHIVLAGHNDRVEFRELKLFELSAAKPKPESSSDNSPPAGFRALFNGKDLDGWKGLTHKNAVERRLLEGESLRQAQQHADQVMREHWSVVDGVLTYDGKGESLCTAQDFGDFELYVDWKIPPGADSGIYLRGTPQVQIWDPWDTRTKPGNSPPQDSQEWVKSYRNGRNLGSGGLWNNTRWRNAPTTLADNPPGQWNTFFIRMVGERVSIWLNGKKIVDRVKLENYWDKSGRTGLPRTDQIELQHHGSELFFKNIYIRELPF